MAEPSSNTVAALEEAVAAVKAAKVPKDLRVAAFNAAFYGSGGHSEANLGPSAPSRPAPAKSSSSSGESKGVGEIAAKLELDEAAVGLVFDVDEDGVHLTLKRDSLSPTNKVAQQEVTYLVTAGRQALGLEDWTATTAAIAITHDRGVQEWLGHADPGFTLRTYVHLMDAGSAMPFFDGAVAPGDGEVGNSD